MKRLFCYWLVFGFSFLAINGCSKNQHTTDLLAIPSIGNSTIEIFHSKKIGDYKISIYQPSNSAPITGWPIIYLLDGDSFFKQTIDIIKTLPNQAIVVAIDYSDNGRRALDYLPKPTELTLEILSNGKINIPQAYGGADNFLSFLQTELKPNLQQRLNIDLNRQIIFGHSYGGLFVLHTLFTQSDAFSDYIASSPSIWFSGRYIMQEAADFIVQTNNSPLSKAVTLQITVGEFEQSLTGQEGFSSAHEKQLRLKHMQNRRMVDNTKDLAQMLIKAQIKNLYVDYYIYPQQTHQSVPLKVLQDRLPILLKK